MREERNLSMIQSVNRFSTPMRVSNVSKGKVQNNVPSVNFSGNRTATLITSATIAVGLWACVMGPGIK